MKPLLSLFARFALSFAKMLSASKSRRLINMKGSLLRSYKLEGQGILNRPPSGIGKCLPMRGSGQRP
jgi:hypothetical protein